VLRCRAWEDDYTGRVEGRNRHFAKGAPFSALAVDGGLYLDSFLQVGGLWASTRDRPGLRMPCLLEFEPHTL
jgi:hypothetical protein